MRLWMWAALAVVAYLWWQSRQRALAPSSGSYMYGQPYPQASPADNFGAALFNFGTSLVGLIGNGASAPRPGGSTVPPAVVDQRNPLDPFRRTGPAM